MLGGFFVGAFLVGLLLVQLVFWLVGKKVIIPHRKGLLYTAALLVAIIWTIAEYNS